MKNSLVEYKLQIRDYITHNSKKLINFKLVISFLPIFVGIYNNVYYKYNKQIILTCLKSNLPGICLEPTKVLWQTFDQKLKHELNLSLQNLDISAYGQPVISQTATSKKTESPPNLLITNKKNVDNKYSIQQINFYNNFILININKNLHKKQKNLYIGIFRKSSLNLNNSWNSLNNQNSQNSLGYNWISFSAKYLTNKSFSFRHHKKQNVSNKKLFDKTLHQKFTNFTKKFNFLQISKNSFINLGQNTNFSRKQQSLIPNLNILVCSGQTSFGNFTCQNSFYLQNLLSRYYLNTNLIKYQTLLNLDELPIKLNQGNSEIQILQRKFSKSPVKKKSSFFLQVAPAKQEQQSSAELLKKKNFQQSFENFQSSAKNFLSSKNNDNLPTKSFYIQNFLNKHYFRKKKSQNLYINKKKQFLFRKISNFSSVFNINIFFNKKKNRTFFFRNLKPVMTNSWYTNKSLPWKLTDLQSFDNEIQNFNLGTRSSEPILLQGVPNFPQKLISASKPRQNVLENFIQKSSFQQYAVENLLKKKTSFSDSVNAVSNFSFFPVGTTNKNMFLENLKNKKIYFLQHLIKHYSLSTNLTPIVDSKLLEYFNLVSDINRPVEKINIQINPNSNLQYSFELLKYFEQFIYITKNTQLPPRIMSGYFVPDVNNKNSLFTLRTMNSFLVKIKISKNFLQQNFNRNATSWSKLNWPSYDMDSLIINKKKETKFKQNRYQNFFFESEKLNKYFQLFPQPADYIEKIKKTGKIIQHYIGPSINQNDKTNDLEIKNFIDIKKYINQFIYSDNPLTDNQESFFGKNVSYLNSESFNLNNEKIKNLQQKLKDLKNENDNLKKKDLQNENNFFIKLPLLKKGIAKKFSIKQIPITSKTKINLNDNVSSYKTICLPTKIFYKKNAGYILFLNNSDWSQFLTTLSKIKKNVTLNSKLPISFFSYISNFDDDDNFDFDNQSFSNKTFPKLVTSKPSFTEFKANEFQFSDQILSCILGPVNQLDLNINKSCEFQPINYHYFPYFQTLIKENEFTKFLFGKTYKKNYSVFTNKFLKQGYSTTNFQNKTKYFSVEKKPGTQSPASAGVFFQQLTSPKTSFYTNKIKFFYQVVEPITLNSWLFLTQFSIGFFLISVFTNILHKYQQEMNYAISNLLENKDSNNNELNSDQNSERPKFKTIKKVLKNFDNIAGIDSILPELAEIIWFLRNSGRSFKKTNVTPQRILLTGPPGTGKTLLVQAIAGEADVPILVESGSSLAQSDISGSSSDKLKNLFNQARKMAPCIIFIDEIDTFGQARNAMMKTPLLNNSILDSIYTKSSKLNHGMLDSSFFSRIDKKNSFFTSTDQSHAVQNESSSQNQNKLKQEKANLLLQFLIELDSISNEKRILIFGATNREQTLDLALTRPGRFNKILKLKLPNKQKRIEIIKLYIKNLGFSFPIKNPITLEKQNLPSKFSTSTKNIETSFDLKNIKSEFNSFTTNSDLNKQKSLSWEYLANLTLGLSAADLASAINQSAIKAIQIETTHTLETIEDGIKSITGSIIQKNKIKTFLAIKRQQNVESVYSVDFQHQLFKNKTFFFINKLAFYQAGKLVVQTLLKKHPAIISSSLWPQVQYSRSHLINSIFEKEFSQLFQKMELESRLVGFYAGKAGEFLGSKKLQLFNFGLLQGKLKKYNLKKKKTLQQYLKKRQQIVSGKPWIKNQIQLKNAFYFYQSDFGIQDINFGNWLVELMVNKWFFYSKKNSIKQINNYLQKFAAERIFRFSTALLQAQLSPNQRTYLLNQRYNEKQILNLYLNDSLKQKSNQIEKILNIQNSTNSKRHLQTLAVNFKNHQNWTIRSNFQKKIIQKLGDEEMCIGLTSPKKINWYKIYGGDHQENENTKYAQSDLYYHTNLSLINLKWLFCQPLSYQSSTNTVVMQKINQRGGPRKNPIVKPYRVRKFSFKSTGLLNDLSGTKIIDKKYKSKLGSKKLYVKSNLLFLCKKTKYKVSFFNYDLNTDLSNDLRKIHCTSLNTIISWNEILKINYDYISANLILICLNKSISILHYNRELFDVFISSLLQNEILREYQIKQIAKNFANK